MTLDEIATLTVAAAMAVATGLALALAIVVRAALQSLAAGPAEVTPEAFQAERLKADPPGPDQFPPDRAWPIYVRRQLHRDAAELVRHSRTGARAVVSLWADAFLRGRFRDIRFWWAVFPLPVVTFAALLTLLVVLPVLTALELLVLYAFFMPAMIASVLILGVLRGAEAGWARIRGTRAICTRPPCYHDAPRPAFRCPGCSELHRDIRAGWLGVLHRRCACGTLLPTMVLRAAWKLPAVCQRCGLELPRGAGGTRDMVIPIFGDVAAGKTRFLSAALDSLIAAAREGGPTVSFPDDDSEDRAEVALSLLRAGEDTVKTADELPHALTCRIGSGATSTLLHLFDAAGERFRGAAGHDDLGFLGSGQGLVYVIDPFALPAVTERLPGQGQGGLAVTVQGNPETAYGEVVSRLRGSGVQAGDQRLAVVVSRADLLKQQGLAPAADSAAISDWLYENGLHNIVLAAKQEFADVRYFLVASLAAGLATQETDPGSPLRWLAGHRGLRLRPAPAYRYAAANQDRKVTA